MIIIYFARIYVYALLQRLHYNASRNRYHVAVPVPIPITRCTCIAYSINQENNQHRSLDCVVKVIQLQQMQTYAYCWKVVTLYDGAEVSRMGATIVLDMDAEDADVATAALNVLTRYDVCQSPLS